MNRREYVSVRFVLVSSLLVLAMVFAVDPTMAQDKTASKVDSRLLELATPTAVQRSATAQGPSGELTALTLPLRIRNGSVLIDAVAHGDLAALEADLRALGMQEAAGYGRICSGWLPISAIGDLEALDSLRLARPSYSLTQVGLVTSQGDAAMGTDEARADFGLDGTGLKVGVLSDTFDNRFAPGLTDYAADVANGDLPAGVDILDDSGGPGIDEGRAMAQLIYDAAPAVDLAFHTAFTGQAGFALGIEELAGCPPGSDPACGTTPGGASAVPSDVIVDDIIYFAEPMFQDGIIAQAVDTVTANGVPYFSSSGNQERLSYESGFRDSGVALGFNAIPDCGLFGPPPIFPGIAHDFDPGAGVDIFQEFTINPGQGVGSPFVFQWDEPFASVSGLGSFSDYDIFLVLTDDGGLGLSTPCVLQGSAADNILGDPVEIMGGVSLGGGATQPVEVAIMVVEFFAFSQQAGLMKWVSFGGNSPDEYDTRSGSSYGHANAAGAEGVGAAFYAETPAFGVAPPLIEPFSSAGGTPILFATDGTRLAVPEVRLKPGITAPDGTNTTFFGFDIEPDGFPNFFGTSAAAPHAAAVAALLLQVDSSQAPGTVYDAMRSTAIDMDDPATPGFDTGFDFGTGFGLVDARAAALRAAQDPGNPKKVLVCHKGRKTLSIGAPALSAHLRHGDELGPCD